MTTFLPIFKGRLGGERRVGNYFGRGRLVVHSSITGSGDFVEANCVSAVFRFADSATVYVS